MLTDALLLNALVLFAVLASDIGPARKLSTHRILRPVLMAGAIVPLFLDSVATRGNGLTLEIIGAGLGIGFGLLSSRLIRVRYDRATGTVRTSAGFAYAAVWTAVIAARSAFSIGADHWFTQSLTTWLTTHQIGANALTDTLIFMAVAMTLTRTLILAARGHQVRQAGTVRSAAVAA